MILTRTDDELMGVYLRQWHFLLAALKRRTGSPELAEDALQETWLRIAGMQKPAVPIRDGNAFVLRIAANIATDLIRKEGRHVAQGQSVTVRYRTIVHDGDAAAANIAARYADYVGSLR